MNARATSPRRPVATGGGLAGLLLLGTLATAAPAGASLPVDHGVLADRTTTVLVLVNGVHTAAGAAAKLARLPQPRTVPADAVAAQSMDVAPRTC